MPMASFDTISVAKRLEEEFAMPRQQAEGVAVVMHENLVGNLATKDDVQALNEKIDTSVAMLNEKIDTSVAMLEERVILKMTVRTGTLVVGGLLFFEVLNRVFPIGAG